MKALSVLVIVFFLAWRFDEYVAAHPALQPQFESGDLVQLKRLPSDIFEVIYSNCGEDYCRYQLLNSSGRYTKIVGTRLEPATSQPDVEVK